MFISSDLVISLLLFILGTSVGSFLSVLVDRIPRSESVIKGRSHCDSCHHTLSWYDLFPLFSFLLLRGKCRYCHKKIGWQTFIVELLTGSIFAATFYFFPLTNASLLLSIITLLYTLFLFASFIVITFIDINEGIIPNKIVYPAFIVALLYSFINISSFPSHLLSAFVAGGFFFFLFAITKGRGMGFGDVKLAVLLGMFLGFPNTLIALYLAFLTGAFLAFILIVARKKKLSGGTIPFGPFLILGTIIASFYGTFLWHYILYFFI